MLEKDEFVKWRAIFAKAKMWMGPDRDAMLDSAAELMERDLILVGATAIEDKLQLGVGLALQKIY